MIQYPYALVIYYINSSGLAKSTMSVYDTEDSRQNALDAWLNTNAHLKVREVHFGTMNEAFVPKFVLDRITSTIKNEIVIEL
jgi:hypothetical protein